VTFTDAVPAGGTFTYTATDGTTVGAAGLVNVSQDAIGSLDGTAGDDILVSTNSGATLIGGTGNDVLMGGSGNDTYQFAPGSGKDIIYDSGGGQDNIQLTGFTSFAELSFERIDTDDLKISFDGQQVTVRDHYAAGAHNVESVNFGGATYLGYALGVGNYVISTDSSTPLNEGGGADIIASSSGSETLNGGSGNDLLFGNDGIDTVNGEAGNDLLVGGGGNDIINGSTGNDTISGGAGGDNLTGGGDADRFVYTAVTDSQTGAGNFDTIADFNGVNDTGTDDVIDLSAIDADPGTLGDQAFTFVAAQTSGVQAHAITWEQTGGNTIVRIDVDGNTGNGAEMEIRLTGVHNLTAADFVP
jgi:Ca2+-binding RTX toxin-like protein